jgi:hypothetical protein
MAAAASKPKRRETPKSASGAGSSFGYQICFDFRVCDPAPNRLSVFTISPFLAKDHPAEPSLGEIQSLRNDGPGSHRTDILKAWFMSVTKTSEPE